MAGSTRSLPIKREGLRGLTFALALLAAPAAAQPADVVSPAPDSVVLTLYRERGVTSRDLQEDPDAAESGLVMVTETRTLDLPVGVSRIAFRGVADGMIPQTAAVSGLPAPVAEQNYDYDLLTPGALGARSVGGTVTLARTNPVTGRLTEERAVVRSAPNGVVLDVDGRIEALDCAGLPERLVFDGVPEGLAYRPTLSLLTTAPTAGRRTVKLSYLATGLAWSADYVARLNPDGRTMDLTGWLTLANNTDTTFGQAPTEVVAGDLAREDVDRIEPRRIVAQSRCWSRRGSWGTPSHVYEPPPPAPPPPLSAPMALQYRDEGVQEIVVTGSRLARQSELGDYKLYTLPERTTVAAHQVKQVRFLDKRKVLVDRVYVVELMDQPDEEETLPAEILLRTSNEISKGLGTPLPAGTAVVMEWSGERLAFVGEDDLDDVPVGLPVEVTLGEAATVFTRQVLLDETEVRDDRVRRSYSVELSNARPTPVRLEVRHPEDFGLRILRENRRHTMKDGRPLWILDLPPNSRETLTYTVEAEG